MKRPSFFGCRLIWVQHPLHPSAVTGQCGPLSVLSLSLSFLFVTDTACLGWESGKRTQKRRQQWKPAPYLTVHTVKSAGIFLKTKDLIIWVTKVAVQELCCSFALPHKCHNTPVAAHRSLWTYKDDWPEIWVSNSVFLFLCHVFTACRTNETVQPVLPPLKKKKKTIIGREAIKHLLLAESATILFHGNGTIKSVFRLAQESWVLQRALNAKYYEINWRTLQHKVQWGTVYGKSTKTVQYIKIL